MTPGLVSIVIPSRNERFLDATVRDLLAKAAGPIEILVVLEGYWPNPPLPDDPRLKILHRGRAMGMRPAINAAASIATGQFLMKVDAHVMVAPGFDEALKADYLEDNWVLQPRRYALDPEAWGFDESRPDKYPVDYEYLSNPLKRPDDPTCGLHGTVWPQRKAERAHLLLDADMSGQGSAWFMGRRQWDRLGPLNVEMFGNFYGEFQEVGLKAQMLGGAVMRTKRTWFAHLRKGARWGRGYSLGPNGHKNGAREMFRICMLNQWPGQVRTLESLIESFMPVPGWPTDLDTAFREAREMLRAA